MAGHQNETRRHFELRNLDKDMERAAAEAGQVMPRETHRALRIGNWALLATLLFLIGLLAKLLGIF